MLIMDKTSSVAWVNQSKFSPLFWKKLKNYFNFEPDHVGPPLLRSCKSTKFLKLDKFKVGSIFSFKLKIKPTLIKSTTKIKKIKLYV